MNSSSAAEDFDGSARSNPEAAGSALPYATAQGHRVHLSAYLGSLYATFHVDIVVNTSLTGEPDTVPPLTPLLIEGLPRPPYRAFPLPGHCADKLCTIIETHEQAGQVRASTRVKDLEPDPGRSDHRHLGSPQFRELRSLSWDEREAVLLRDAHSALSSTTELLRPPATALLSNSATIELIAQGQDP